MVKKAGIFLLVFLMALTNGQQNNACKNYMDYFHMENNPNCYYEPDVDLPIPDIIKRHVGVFESYNVTAEDGYITSIFRIPRKNPKAVVILMHPVTVDSFVWVGQSNESLAFYLWEAGYDIWMPNSRGTPYSLGHVEKSKSHHGKKYWNYSFHEIGLYEYPAVIDFVRKMTGGDKVFFIGHSMSSTASFIYSSLRPDHAAEGVKVFIQICPVAYLKNLPAAFKAVAKVAALQEVQNKILGRVHTPKFDSFMSNVTRRLGLKQPFKIIHVLERSLSDGFTPSEFDPALVNLAIAHLPIRYAYKINYHYIQQVNSGGRFQMYDYGKVKNQKIYGSEQPPEYPVENIIAPQYLIYSTDDFYATVGDAEALYDKLQKPAKRYGKYKLSGLNHIDVHYGKHRKQKLYDKILAILDILS